MEKLRDNTFVAMVSMVAIVLIVAVVGVSISGNAVLKSCDELKACEPGEYFSMNACKCLKEAQGKSDLVNDCQLTCGIGPYEKMIREEQTIDGVLTVVGLDVVDTTMSFCTCQDNTQCDPNYACLSSEFCLFDVCTPGCYGGCLTETSCINDGGQWCEQSNNLKARCMKDCLGVPQEDLCFAGTGCTTQECCRGNTGYGCPDNIRCAGFNEHYCAPDCAIIAM